MKDSAKKTVAALTWPAERAGEAVQALAAAAGLGRGHVSLHAASGQKLGSQLESAARQLGVEVEPVEARYFELESVVARSGPAILHLAADRAGGLIALLGCGSSGARVVAPDLRVHRLSAETLRSALAGPLEEPVRAGLEEILEQCEIRESRRRRARRALLDEHLGPAFVASCWILRQPAGASFWSQLRRSGAVTRTLLFTGCHLLQYVLFLCSWWLIGRGALSGHLDSAWLMGWALLLLTLVPLRMLTTLLQGRVVIGTGSLMRRRLLSGVMGLDVESLKHEGAGMLLGRAIEADSLQNLVLGGGHLALLATVEVLVTLWVLWQGAGGAWHTLLFASWVVLIAGIVWRFYRAVDRWTGRRLELTHDLTEQMVGHRTRLAQQPPAAWHEHEDQSLDAYLDDSRRMDRIAPYLAQAQFGWRIVGLLGLAAPFVTGSASVGVMAVGLGGVILGSQALARFTQGVTSIAIATIAWRRVAPIFAAASDRQQSAAPAPVDPVDGDRAAVVSAHDLGFSYRGRSRLAIDGASLTIRRGDRILLVGPSGGGKSTLVSLLAGLRTPDSGLVMCHGLDMATLGSEGWRQHIATAPQFHDNHVLAETFAFNVLMGRSWPPTHQELDEAETLCRELGLGDLLDRMPGGMLQMVGDTGWQLSHGEQSRLFVARALLQDADLVILDESFGALDPENLRLAIDCARRRARSLLVVAHP